MHGKQVPVRAEIEQINSFSVHADASELIDWLKTSSEPPKQIFIVHGEPDSSQSLDERIKKDLNWPCSVPAENQVVAL